MVHSDSLLTRVLLQILENTNFIVTALTACFVLYTRSAGVVYFVAGATLCSLSVKVIKRAIQQPRPAVVVPGKRKRSYGCVMVIAFCHSGNDILIYFHIFVRMPSTHSATIGFYATYILLACTYLSLHPSLSGDLNVRILGPSMAIPGATTIMMSRIWLGYHTWPQVVVGGSYGVVCAVLWFYGWRNGLGVYGEALDCMVLRYTTVSARRPSSIIAVVLFTFKASHVTPCPPHTSLIYSMDDNDPISQFFPGDDSVDLYTVLSLPSDCKLEDIKKAYRRLALTYHPDKHTTSTDDAKADASLKFQQIGFAYSVLSDEKRRARYDKIGKTDEGFDLSAGDDGWEAYFEDLFDRVTKGRLDEMKKEYQGMPACSSEEIEDLISAYETTDGDIGEMMTYVPHSTFDDETRFIVIISNLISKGKLKMTKKWTASSKDEKAKLVRKKQSNREAAEAETLAKELGVWDEFYANGKPGQRRGNSKGKAKSAPTQDEEEDYSALQALILKKKEKNMDSFFDNLAAKYTDPAPRKGRKRARDGRDSEQSSPKKSRHHVPEPPEIDDEEFTKLQSRLFGQKTAPGEPTQSSKQRGTKKGKNG
ncbi:DnaJ domain-containing protein [Cyathus striatus]|nr:DnaJ domain-containing protein [Cyathus striatus]